MKIGLFGGTFNPVHHGHLINAQIIREDFSLNKILFIPSKYPVHKDFKGLAPANDRFNMIKLAVKDNHFFEISRIEIDRKVESYFIFTLRELLKQYSNDELFVIIGTDAFNELDKWKDYKEVIQKVSFIVMKRPGFNKINDEIAGIAREIKFVDNPHIEISSSGIRKNVMANKSIKYLVPAKVEEYIRKRELYKI